MLDFYFIDLHDRCLCSVSGYASTNQKAASLARKYIISCDNHRLHSELTTMVRSHKDLQNPIESVNETMKDARKLKNAAKLRNTSNFVPIVHNETRWSCTRSIFDRFISIRSYSLEVKESAGYDLEIDDSIEFKK